MVAEQVGQVMCRIKRHNLTGGEWKGKEMKIERDGDFDEIWRGTTLHEERKRNLRLSKDNFPLCQ